MLPGTAGDLLDLAQRLDARLIVVTVFSPVLFVPPEGQTPSGSQDRQALLAERRERAEATLATVANDAGIGGTADLKVLAGDAARALIEETKKTEDASLIVVGSRGQGAIRVRDPWQRLVATRARGALPDGRRAFPI